ncbi:MAG: thiamine pyrophosphate-binding protein, partial [Pseudomonadota bacterium]
MIQSVQNSTDDTPQHALHGKTMSGAEIVVQILADEGVNTVFGYSGGAILPGYDAIFRYNSAHEDANINLVVPANEQAAGFMAAGYARTSGDVGVAMVTSGPGATNMVTPIRDSMADSVPLVVICGQVPTTAIGGAATFGRGRAGCERGGLGRLARSRRPRARGSARDEPRRGLHGPPFGG